MPKNMPFFFVFFLTNFFYGNNIKKQKNKNRALWSKVKICVFFLNSEIKKMDLDNYFCPFLKNYFENYKKNLFLQF